MKKISIAIVTFNEEKNIAGCLDSVAWADEVIVVDGSSIDHTAQIAKEKGATVHVVKNEPLMKINMNLSFSKCTSDWIFSLDADERIPTGLKEEIQQILQMETIPHNAYRVPRKNIIFGKWIEHTGWYPDFQMRLFKNGKASFPAKNVHEDLIVDGTVGELHQAMDHLHYDSVSLFVRKLDSYTTVEAQKIIDEGKKVTWTDAIRYPFEEFLSRFFAREGYKDGLHGLVLSLLMAFYWEVIFAKIWEKQGFTPYNSDNFLLLVEKETGRISKEFRYWLMASTQNKMKKVLYKVKNRLNV